MPPKAKFSKEEIINAAFEITRESGIEEVTARGIGARLHSSARPIFTVFKNMEEVHDGIITKAKAIYGEYVQKGLQNEIPFKGVGIKYIQLAQNEPHIFHLLFMRKNENANINTVLPLIEDHYFVIIQSIMDAYRLNEQEAENIYKQIWIYTHGIATLCATQVCQFHDEELNQMLTEVFVSLLMQMKRGNKA